MAFLESFRQDLSRMLSREESIQRYENVLKIQVFRRLLFVTRTTCHEATSHGTLYM